MPRCHCKFKETSEIWECLAMRLTYLFLFWTRYSFLFTTPAATWKRLLDCHRMEGTWLKCSVVGEGGRRKEESEAGTVCSRESQDIRDYVLMGITKCMLWYPWNPLLLLLGKDHMIFYSFDLFDRKSFRLIKSNRCFVIDYTLLWKNGIISWNLV